MLEDKRVSLVEKNRFPKTTVLKILGCVPFEKGFHFYKAIGNYTGITAISLAEFAQKIRTVDAESVSFHFRRNDFQKWIRETIGDPELAIRLSWIEIGLSKESLRQKVQQKVERRLVELEKSLRQVVKKQTQNQTKTRVLTKTKSTKPS